MDLKNHLLGTQDTDPKRRSEEEPKMYSKSNSTGTKSGHRLRVAVIVGHAKSTPDFLLGQNPVIDLG
jgi:hypothetical protein